jgi:hypothetical protein
MFSQIHARAVPEMVQDETLDIQPKGELRFKMIVSAVNRAAFAVDNEEFRNSGFVHVDKISDGRGASMDFVTSPGAWDHINFHVSLNEPVEPGGTITVVSEGTISGLIHSTKEPDVFEYHMDHSPGYDGVTRRVELHRLPPGAALIWKNTKSLKEEKVGDRVELRLDCKIPPGGDLDVRYRYRLSKAQAVRQSVP